MRILLFGGWGQLGCDLAAACETRHDLLRPTHAEAHVTEPTALDAVASAVRPDAVVNAAAFHKGESSEVDPGRSFAVNAVGALNGALAERILLFLERRVPPGIYHAANIGSCSWYQFAKRIFELAGADVSPSPRAAGEQAVRRPHSSILLDTRSAQLGLPANRSWDDALRWYLASRTPSVASSRAGAQPTVT